MKGTAKVANICQKVISSIGILAVLVLGTIAAGMITLEDRLVLKVSATGDKTLKRILSPPFTYYYTCKKPPGNCYTTCG